MRSHRDEEAAEDDPAGKNRRSRRPSWVFLRHLLKVRPQWIMLTASLSIVLAFAAFVRWSIMEQSLPRKTTWSVNENAPAAYRTSQLQQQSFCQEVYRRHGQPPEFMELAWTEEGDGELEYFQSGELTSASGVRLQRVDNIEPPAFGQKGETYSMYIFAQSVFQNDIVSTSLRHNQNWEGMESYSHIGHLDMVARKHKLPRHHVYFIDIGANLGTFSLAAAHAGFSVISIEAMRVNQHALRLSLCANLDMAPNVTLLPYAVGRQTEQCALYTPPSNILNGAVRCGVDETSLGGTGQLRRQPVDIMRLDDLLGKEWYPWLKGRVGALKIDTEGFEPWVFQGGERFFKEVKPRFMQVEVSSMCSDATGVNGTAFLKQLQSYGYEVRLSPHGQAADVDSILIPDKATPMNVYLVPAA